jgi:hypothetical protein
MFTHIRVYLLGSTIDHMIEHTCTYVSSTITKLPTKRNTIHMHVYTCTYINTLIEQIGSNTGSTVQGGGEVKLQMELLRIARSFGHDCMTVYYATSSPFLEGESMWTLSSAHIH